MTQFAPPPAPQYPPQQQFPAQQPPAQPQYPTQPAYQPQYPGQAPQGYPPASVPGPQQPMQQPFQPQQAPQQYGWPQPAPTPPPQPLAQGTLDDFYSQPSTGGSFLKFKAPGDTYFGIVAHTPTKADVRQTTTPPNQGSVPQFYRDGRPKLEMLVSLRMQPTPENPEGVGIFPVKGADRDELARAMSEAGAPEGTPVAGAGIQITFTHEQATRGGIARKVKQVRYWTPEQVASAGVRETAAPAPAQQPAQAQQAGPVQQFAQPAQPQMQQPAPQGGYVPGPGQQPAQQPPQQQAVDPSVQQVAQQFPGAQVAPQPPAPTPIPQQPAAPAAPAAPTGMTPEQQALLARLGA